MVRCSMNLERIFLFFIIFCTILGCVLADVLGKSILLDAALGVLIGSSLIFVLDIIYLLLQIWRPDLPDCVCRKCKSSNYRFIDSMSSIEKRIYLFKFPYCAREYRKHDNRFEFNAPEGVKPYMKISRWGRWVQDISHKNT